MRGAGAEPRSLTEQISVENKLPSAKLNELSSKKAKNKNTPKKQYLPPKTKQATAKRIAGRRKTKSKIRPDSCGRCPPTPAGNTCRYTQNLKDLANSIKPLCPADISPIRGDFEKSRTQKPTLLGEVAAVRLTEGFKNLDFFKYCG